jgi:uncharacterized protein YfbU (UPF0304 family)
MSNDIPDELFKRMVLVNQYQMLALLDVKDREFWEQAAEMTRSGWPVDSLPGVDLIKSYLKDALTTDDQRFVLDAFHVFELLQDAEKKGMKPTQEHAFTKFPGFDGNNEGQLLSYARHIRQNEHRFEYVELAGNDLNSHFPAAEMYQRMIVEWERQGRPLYLNQEQFDGLLLAQSHPSRRQAASHAEGE